jgi:hypothetical protein
MLCLENIVHLPHDRETISIIEDINDSNLYIMGYQILTILSTKFNDDLDNKIIH